MRLRGDALNGEGLFSGAPFVTHLGTAHWCTWARLESALHDLSRHSCGGASDPRAHSSMGDGLAAILAARVMPSGITGLSWHPAGQSRRGVSRGGTSCRHGSGRRQNGRLFAIGAGVEADVVGLFSLIWTTVLGKCPKRSLQKWPRASPNLGLLSPKLGLVRTLKGPHFAWYS